VYASVYCAPGDINTKPFSGNQVGAPPRFFLLILYTYKNVRNLCFYDFSWFSETNGLVSELFSKTIAESLYIGYAGTMLPMVTWYVANFGHLTNISMQFSMQNLFGQIWPPIPCMWRVFLHHDLIWQNGSYTCMTFYAHKQKFSSEKSPFLVVPCIKFVWYVCSAVQIQFCCEND